MARDIATNRQLATGRVLATSRTLATGRTLAALTIPNAPLLTSAIAGDTQVELYWNFVSNAVTYNVYRALITGGPYSSIATGLTGGYLLDSGRTNGTQYFYVVTAVNGAGESGVSNELSATPAPPAPSGPTLIQQKTNAAASGATLVVTLDAAPTAGNSLIACIGHSASRTVTGISGGGVTWTQGPHDETNRGVDIWYGHNSSGSGTAITISLSSGIVSAPSANISEWSGLNNAAPNSTNTNTGASDTVLTSNSVSPPAPIGLVIATFATVSGVYDSGPTNSFTRLTQASATTALDSAYQIEASTGTYSTGFAYTIATAWGAAIASFAASGPSSAIVSGAGTVAVNGTYTYRQDYGGRPSYTLEGQPTPPDPSVDEFSIAWIAGTLWGMDTFNGLYNSTDDVAFPWQATWEVNNGDPPAPTVTAS